MKLNINYYYKYYLEIKHRLFLIAFCWFFTAGVCYYYKNYLLFAILNNIKTLNNTPYFIFTDISEIFYSYINLIFFITNQIGLVILLYHILIFLTFGLYERELLTFKMLFKTFLVTWLLSSILFYKFLIPFSLEFFLTFQQNETIGQPISLFLEAKLYDFLNYFITFYNMCFFSCQFLTVILFFLNKIINKKKHIKFFRKIFYLIFLIFSTIITPPDVFSQLLITFYLILIYEITIFFSCLKFNLVTN